MKRLIIGLSILLSVVLAFSIYTYVEKSALSVTVENQRKVIDNHEAVIEKYLLKEEADSLFFGGKLNEAFDKYKYLDKNFKSNFEQTRINWVNNLDELEASSIQLTLQLKEELEQYKLVNDKSAQLIFVHESEIESLKSKSASTEKLLYKQRDSLLSNFEKERKKLLSNRDSDTLSFKSSKNHLVRFYGQMSNNKANGIGSATWSTGGYYFGMWKDNMRNGNGLYCWKDGECYEGEFLNDKRNGIGKYLWNDGSKYEGSWKNDQRNGFGTLYDSSGKVKFKGEWENDAPKT